MKTPIYCHLVATMLGLAFGFCLSRVGFSKFDEVHRMFLFADLRLTLSFAVAVLVCAVGMVPLQRISGRAFAAQRIHPGTVPGGLMFGAGWALCGACPAIVWVQLGEGQLSALAALGGMVAGTVVYPHIHARFFGWPTESCSG